MKELKMVVKLTNSELLKLRGRNVWGKEIKAIDMGKMSEDEYNEFVKNKEIRTWVI